MAKPFKSPWVRTKGIRGPAYQQNIAYAERLNDYVKGVPKIVLGVYAATALHNAVLATHKDSNRAAANWNIQFGSESLSTEWNPAMYNAPGVADRGAGGAFAEMVVGLKKGQYGYNLKNGFMVPDPGGAIYEKLRIGLSGTTRVTLYNPIFSPRSWLYREHAFMHGSTEISTAIAKGQNFFGIDAIDSTFVPKLIRELAQQVRWGRVNKAF